MKNITYLLSLVLVLLITACTQDFQEINTNPNTPTTVQPSLLLRQVIYDYGEEMSYEGFVAGNLLSQHLTMIDFNLFDRHDLTAPQVGGNPWPVLYTNLRDNEILLEQARSNPSATVYEGPVLILKAYFVAALTDIYGDVPYFDALDGQDGNVTPKYDAQEEIYLAENGILDNLRKAVEAIENYGGAQALEGDILYGGDLDAWLKLANSLRIKYAVRISGVQSSNELQAIYESGNFIQSNAENATFDFTDGQPNNFRMARLRDGDFNLFIMSETTQEILQNL
ncbi:MAG: SusD/RagB family nutrient-binding outer membrane lipoprotein, partial [Bacteroidota bacterium]